MTDYREPHSVFEWQEIMQHFFSKTRLMDWSESLLVALEFAMEAFLIPYKNLDISEKRRKLQPTLWILQPNQLNDKVYDALLEGKDFPLLKRVGQGLNAFTRARIGNELKANKDIYFSLQDKKEGNYSNIVSLSALEELKRSYTGRETEAVKRLEFNPLFYLLLRIYCHSKTE